jgi:hypothetical protein
LMKPYTPSLRSPAPCAWGYIPTLALRGTPDKRPSSQRAVR